KRRIGEGPLRRRELPDEPGEFVAVLLVASATALGREVELVPPLELRLGRQRHLPRFLIADQIAADRDERLAALRPQRRDDGGRSGTPVEAREGSLVDLERVHQCDDIGRQRGWLAVPRRLLRNESGR